PRLLNVIANTGAYLDHRLDHFRLDLLAENHLAFFQKFGNVATQFARLRIYNLELFLDSQSELTEHSFLLPLMVSVALTVQVILDHAPVGSYFANELVTQVSQRTDGRVYGTVKIEVNEPLSRSSLLVKEMKHRIRAPLLVKATRRIFMVCHEPG